MLDKCQRNVSVTRNGEIITVRMRGGLDCLWLNMYLDTQVWQMTCDSDVGSYAFHWGKPMNPTESFLKFCLGWLGNEDWLLRKCVGERHQGKNFMLEESENHLRKMITDYYDGDDDFKLDEIDDILCDAAGYSDSAQGWGLAVQVHAEWAGVELPEEWYECIHEDYTPMQKRFAEICREVIVPELRKLEG